MWQNTAWGAEPNLQYGYIGPLGSLSGEGLDFIIGQKFMERFYAVSPMHCGRRWVGVHDGLRWLVGGATRTERGEASPENGFGWRRS